MVRSIDEVLYSVESTECRLMYGLIASATVRWASTWSEPFWASSSTTKMAICFQNRLLLSPSTTRPSARSLSPSDARTVGLPGFVPDVWSLGSLRIDQAGHLARLLEPGQLLEEPVGALDVGIVHVEAAEHRVEVALAGS